MLARSIEVSLLKVTPTIRPDLQSDKTIREEIKSLSEDSDDEADPYLDEVNLSK